MRSGINKTILELRSHFALRITANKSSNLERRKGCRWNQEAGGWKVSRHSAALCLSGSSAWSQSSRPREWRLRSLKVSVNLEAVVARVGDSHVSVRGEGQTLRAVQRVGWGVDVGEEGACAVEHLKSRPGRPVTEVQWYLRGFKICLMTTVGSVIVSLFLLKLSCA